MTDEAARDTNEPEAETALVDDERKIQLAVEIENVGPCRKHVKVTIPPEEVDQFRAETVEEFSADAEVPGFRKGRVPSKLIERRFKDELNGQVKQKILLGSLEQITKEYEIEPINEPDFDIEQLEIPDEGEFIYEFDVEVRPEFDLPDYRGLPIQRPVRKVAEADVEKHLERFLSQYGEQVTSDEPATVDDFVATDVTFEHDGRTLHEIEDLWTQIRPVLRFEDAELEGFDELMSGVRVGDVRETSVTISAEAEQIPLRGESVKATFRVKEVSRRELPELSAEFFDRIGVESEIGLRDEIRNSLERQVAYQQRQSARRQVLEKITASADWDLPEELVRKQVENAIHREQLEMQQSGFTPQDVRSRMNELRQNAVSETRQALKEHFVLDRIAEEEDIEVLPSEIDMEIRIMAMQRGESPRRMRAKLQKSGVIENLDAQIRERKAIDFILEHAEFEEIEMDPFAETQVEAVEESVCGMQSTDAREDETESDDEE